MKSKNTFGETVEGYNVPVLNEREIRASAGILFLFVFIALMQIIFKQNFLMIKYVIVFFLIDFGIRIFASPKFSPSLVIGRMIVSKKTPEYVGAAQKKFAWKIGFVLGLIMLIGMVVLNTYSIITGLICLICLVFLYFESVFGICLGCLFYPLFYKEKQQLCPGDICEVKIKHDIQKVTFKQIAILLLSIALLVFYAIYFNDYLSQTPTALF